jgi:hypothetical protein
MVSFRREDERQAIDALDPAARASRQLGRRGVLRGPDRAAQFRTADFTGFDRAERRRDLADERTGVRLRRLHHPQDAPPEHEEQHDAGERELEPLRLRRAGEVQRREHADKERGHAEEDEEEAAGHELERRHREAQQGP